MCGRYTLAGKPVDLEKHLRVRLLAESYTSSYNIAPGQNILCCFDSDPHTLRAAHWGMVPYWAKTNEKPITLINVRDDSLFYKKGFAPYRTSRHCLIAASGFYEWKAIANKKQPYYFHCLNQPFVFFAGIYENQEQQVPQVAIVTTQASACVAPVHNRMPVILNPAEAVAWLEEKNDATDLLQPYPAEEMEAYPVSTAVNRALENNATLIEPISALNSTPTLFDEL
ncbi:MAG: SOS response-associated peptidase [Bacteroidia bacterium]|jgi:putative SOS response-associated peptidase YedK